MRDALLPLRSGQFPDHAGLCYELAPPLKPGEGKIDPDRAGPWFKHLEGLRPPQAYSLAYARWRASFDQAKDAGRARLIELEARSRLLIGHGNAAPTGVGLTVSRTW